MGRTSNPKPPRTATLVWLEDHGSGFGQGFMVLFQGEEGGRGSRLEQPRSLVSFGDREKAGGVGVRVWGSEGISVIAEINPEW